jgi:CheY-like chemotaxis protein
VTGPTVLCVDDHVLLLASLKRALNHQGLNAVVAADGVRATRVLRRLQVDAMIIDLRLPDMSGLALIKTARLLGVEAPAIVYTAYPDSETAARAKRMGVRYISKHDVRSIRSLIDLVRADIDADVTLRASASDESSYFETLASGLETDWSSAFAGRDYASLALARVLVDVKTPFPLFLAAAESFLLLTEGAATLREAIAFMRVQAQRCHARSSLAQQIRLQAIVESIDRSGPEWQRFRADADVKAPADADADRGLQTVGWSLDYVICGAALRRAVMLVAHTREHVAQIGYQLGFEQPPLFGRFFRRLLGLAPGEFRDLIRRI